MKITPLIISSILLTLALSVKANYTIAHTIKPILSLNSCTGLSDSTINTQVTDKNIYKLIISGNEKKIRNYFKEVTAEYLLKTDSGAIAKAFKRINTNDKVTRTIWILEEVKNRKVEIRTFVYNELIKIDYKKPSFFLKYLVNNYFTNYYEPVDTLKVRVNKLQKKMNNELWF